MFGFHFTERIPSCVNRLICIIVLCLSIGTTYGSTDWPNEPAGSQVLYDCPFSNSICGMGNTYNTQAYANFSNAPLSPSSVFDYYMAAGSTKGNGEWGLGLPNARELYIGTWWSTNADFVGNSAANKMLFLRNAAIDNNYLHWWGSPGQPKQIIWSMQATYDNTGPGEAPCYSCGDGSGSFMPNTGNSAFVAAGSGWHRIELYMKASTTKTSRDGVVRWWLDGKLVGNYPTVNLTPGGFNEFQINSTWDGFNTANRDLTKSWHHYYDHMRISVPNCGTNGCPAPSYLVINSSLPAARTGTPFTATLSADGGTKPYTWFRESGNLPAGLSLNPSTGVISGTPTCVGRSDFTIRVTDGSQPALSAKKSYTVITSGTSTSCPSAVVTGSETRMGRAQFTAKAVGGKATFKLPVTGSAQYRLSVYDLAGKKVYDHASTGQNETIIVTNLKSGVYLAKFSQGKQASRVRFNMMN